MNAIEELYEGLTEIDKKQKQKGTCQIEEFMAEIVIAFLQRIPKQTIEEIVIKSGLNENIEKDLVSYINAIS